MKPNILFLFPDQMRADWNGESEASKVLRIPTLDKLAKYGSSFTKAFTPSPLCAPARACIATGLNYPQSGVKNNSQNLPNNSRTVYQSLQDGGYHVMGCGKFDLHKASFSWGKYGTNQMSEWGFSDGIDNEGKMDGVNAYKVKKEGPYLSYLEDRGRAQIHVDDFAKRKRYGTFATELDDEDYCDNWITGNALTLLDRAPKNKPWFLQVNFAGPHEPFDITKKMSDWYKNVEFPKPFGEYDKSIDHNSIRKNYAAMIENIDKNIEKILNHNRIKFDKDNTIIVFASDHGDMLGDKGYFAKCLPYNGSTNVPLIFSGCSIPKDKVINQPVSIIDLPATFLDIAGIENNNSIDSISLLPLINNNKVKRASIISSLYVDNNPLFQWDMIVSDNYKYIKWKDGKQCLYDLDDYREKNNLINNKIRVKETLEFELFNI